MWLTDRAYIVTGAGSGIGEAAAKRVAAEGGRVVVADVDEAGGRRVVDEIKTAGGAAVFAKANVSEEADANGLVTAAIDAFGRLDGAINNAGIGQPVQRLHELDIAAWDRLHGVDLRGVFLCMRAEIRHLLANGGGAIVNTASIAGLTAVEGQGAYVAAKHGVVGLTRQAAMEYVRDNIRVNAVAPGLVATPQFMSFPEKDRAMYEAAQPNGRAARPEEIANVMAWLLSDQASIVSGDVVLADGTAMLK